MFSKLKKGSLIFAIVIVSYFGGGMLAQTESCSPEEAQDNNSFVQTVVNYISFNTSKVNAACESLTYMGGKWSNYTNIRFYDGLDSSKLSTALSSASNHYNAYAPKVYLNDLTESEYDSWNRIGIIVQDNNYTSSEWTGKAEGSYKDGKFPDSYYSQVNILLNTKNSNGLDVRDYSAWKLQGLVGHELGHSIGLGHSTSTSRLMYCYDSRSVNTLATKDKEIIEAIY